MNSDDLDFFRLVAGAGSISAAAVKSGMDASTISRRISHLEKDVGIRLFNRSGRGVALTTQGETLLDYSRQVGSLMDSARAAMASTDAGPARIHIAAQPTIAKVMFGHLFHAIQKRFPKTRIHFTEGLAHQLLGELQSGDIDIAVLYRPEHPGSLAYEPLLMERLHLLTPNDSQVTADQLRSTGLADVPLLLPSTQHGMRVLVQAMMARRLQVPNVVLESDSSIAITVELVKSRCGCTVLPLAAAEAEIESGALRAIPIEGDDGERCVALVMGRTHIAAADLWSMNELIRELTRQLVLTQQWPGTRAI